MIRRGHQDDLDYLEVSNENANAKIALQGAHIFHFQAKKRRPLLWLSKTSRFKKRKAIRGGIPICWPWFGAHEDHKTLPNHGFARTSLWEHTNTEEITSGETRITLRLRHCKESLKLWPYRFELSLTIMIASELKLSLTTKNLDSKAFKISSALHSYLAIEEISSVYIEGLEQKYYYDKVDDSFDNRQEGRLYVTQETDRIYQEVHSPLFLQDSTQRIKIETEGSGTVVVWNPGEELAGRMPDLSDHRSMLCIESANALEDEVEIQPDRSHTLSTMISQE